MDHLPPVANPHNPVIVPYLGFAYAGHGFSDFVSLPPSLDLATLRGEDTPLEALTPAAPYLQAWFFFGILREVLDVPVVLTDFIKCHPEHKHHNDDESHDLCRQVITTHKLTAYLALWKRIMETHASHGSDAQRTTISERVVTCLKESFRLWRSIPKFAAIVGNEVELSIQILCCTLEHALNCVVGIPIAKLPWRRTRSQFLTNRMLDDGWCASTIWHIWNPSRLVWQYYASQLGAPSPRHSPDAQCQAGDSVCRLKLKEMSSDESSDEHYAPKHVCATNNCPLLHASGAASVEDLVKDGKIPLLEYHPVAGTLLMRPYTPGLQYTAISHVWTDGMGNSRTPVLPTCQLSRINTAMSRIPWTNKALAASINSDKVWETDRAIIELSAELEVAKKRPMLFWIDTICVPRSADLRKQAINGMRSVYNLANRVLVFDASLSSVRGKELCSEEILTRVSLSNWVHRFWTLQEAVMAKVLWFEFADDCYRQMLSGVDVRQLTYANEIEYHCADFDFDWRSHAPHFTEAQRMAMVWSGFSLRASRFREDQPVCVATLLDMNIAAVQDVDGYDTRLMKLWASYNVVPTGVLFLVTPRIERYPLHWAPNELTSLGMLPPPGASTAAKPTENGLELTHHGIMTGGRLKENRHGVIAMKVGEEVYLVCQNLRQSNPPWQGIDFTRFMHLAVLLSQDAMSNEDERQPFEACLGALIGISGNNRGCFPQDTGEMVVEGQYLRAVSVILRGSSWDQGKGWSERDEQEKSDSKASEAAFTHVRQYWRIT